MTIDADKRLRREIALDVFKSFARKFRNPKRTVQEIWDGCKVINN